MFDVCVVGHITKDLIRIDGKLHGEMPGGTAYDTSMALQPLGLKVAVITTVSRADQERLLCDLHGCGVAVFCQESAETTMFEDCYRSENFEDRAQMIHAIAAPFSPDDVAPLDAAFFHLGPLTHRDIPLEVLQAVARKGRWVSFTR